MSKVSIKTRADSSGQYVATCPELSVSCQGQTEEEALSKLQSLICLHVSSQAGLSCVDGELRPVLRYSEGHGVKVLYVPDRIRIH